MPILQAVEGGAVIVFFKAPCQLCRRVVIKCCELFRSNHQFRQSSWLQFDAIPDSWLLLRGELAQLVERCDRTAEVRGSNPLFSTQMRRHNPLLLALGSVVLLSTLARPAALLTFTALAMAWAVGHKQIRRR